MENKYVGDLGDFGKYGLLRFLCRGLRLGVVWYLVADEGHNADGRYIRYLNLDQKTSLLYGVSPGTKRFASQNERRFRACAPDLYDALFGIVRDRARTVTEIRKRGLLPADTVFFEDVLELSARGREERRKQREEWVDAALARTIDCDVVFLDPDNGLELDPEIGRECPGPKYVTYEEVRCFLARGQSVIIYQHFDRGADLVRRRRATIASRLGTEEVSVHALHYRRGTARAFFVIPTVRHEHLLSERITGFLGTEWRQHFDRA